MRRAEGAIGKVLRDKWRIDRLLGIGGMASVFAATHRNGKRAAVKILHPEAALAPTVRDRFLREGYLANRVDHPGAVSILDDDVDTDGTVFLVMELLEGETLDARLTRIGGRLAGGELLQIVDQVLDCLSVAHDKGVVHRDLKPGNLFITSSGQVKILDFGIAQLAEAGKSRSSGTGAQTLGTPGFMPPEQARGRWDEVDAQSDLWAVGAVLFIAVTGKHVHEAPTVNEQLLAAMTEPAKPLREVSPDAPEGLAHLVDRALAYSKGERFPTARAMREELREAYQAIVGAPLTQARRLSVRPPRDASVRADAETIDASVSFQPQVTTARPVTDTPPGQGRSRHRVVGAAMAVAAVVALATAVVVMRSPGEAPVPGPASTPRAPAAPAVEKAPTSPAPAPEPLGTPEEQGARAAASAPAAASAGAPAGAAGGASSGAASALRTASGLRKAGAAGTRASATTRPKPGEPPPDPAAGDEELFTKRR